MSSIVQNLPTHVSSRAEEENASAVGLYVHIPFCRSKCNYCAFVSAAPRSEGEMDRYLEALCHHLCLGASWIGSRKIQTIYFGGGTPSLFGPKRLPILFETISNHFSILSDAEITLEANPESASKELFQTLYSLGLNRVSLGAQSFSDRELQRLGRVHSAGEITRAVENARNAGLTNVSLDLIFALPDQSVEQWQDTLMQALTCKPEHLSLYGLTYEEGTLLERLRIQQKVTPVLDETYRMMYDWTCDYLKDQGWIQYEISNWCVPGKHSRHNRIYWQRKDYLSVGISAHGMIDNVRYSLIRDGGKYTHQLLNGKESSDFDFWHPALMEEKIKLSSEEMASDVMIFGLRQNEGISCPSFKDRFGYFPSDRWEKEIERLVERGWLEQTVDCLRLTSQAVPISNEVFIYFLD